jgi:hypothetical protein
MRKRILVTFLGLGLSLAAWASDGNERGVTSGIAYTNPNQALFINPAALAEAQQTSLEGAWLLDPKILHASVAGSVSSVGLAAGVRHKSGENIFEGGLGVNLGAPKFGLTLRSSNGDSFDGDAGLLFDLSKLRIAVVARGLLHGLDRIDAALGIDLGQVSFEADLKKPLPFDSKIYLMNFGMAVNAKPFLVGVGSDLTYAFNDIQYGGLNASLAFGVSDNFFVEAFYWPFAQEWETSDWAFGLRYTF